MYLFLSLMLLYEFNVQVDICVLFAYGFVVCTEELITYESKRMDAEENMRPPPEPVRARIPFTACLQAFTEPENVPDFWSLRCKPSQLE